ncbi:MAG: hypothetical protein WAX69_11300 [Victivallales bacterium]
MEKKKNAGKLPAIPKYNFLYDQGIKDKTRTNPRNEIKADPRGGEFDPTKIKKPWYSDTLVPAVPG